MEKIRRATNDLCQAFEEGGLRVETPRGCIDADRFSYLEIGRNANGIIFSAEMVVEDHEDLDIATDVVNMHPYKDGVVLWAHDQAFEVSCLAAGSETEIEGASDDPMVFSVDYTFTNVEPL